MKYIDGFWSVVFGFVIGISLIDISMDVGKWLQAREMRQRCASTGMYLTEGYAISCRVLTNEGYAPMIEQEKGKR